MDTPSGTTTKDRGQLVQCMSPNEVISCLWNKSAVEKCRIGLRDVVLFDRGAPLSWYSTGKSGEVIKKRGADLEIISQRWIKIASQSDSPIVAILKQENGLLKLLPLSAWSSFTSQFVPEKSLISLHCFVNGENNAVYRNNYKLKDKLGRVSTSTLSYSLSSDFSDLDNVCVFNEAELNFSECRANQICNVLDLATSTVIRYVEMMLAIRILSIQIDYAIDKKSQIWMLWTSDARFTTRFDDLSTSDLGLHPAEAKVVHDRQGRMSWAGLKYFETEVEEGEKPPYIYENPKTGSPPKPVPASPPKSRQLNDISIATTQLNAAASINKTSGSSRNRSKRRVHDNLSYTLAEVNKMPEKTATRSTTPTSQSLMGTFPQPFKCKGDYCAFHIQPADSSLKVDIPGAENHIVEKLFSQTELVQLRKDRMFTQMMSFGAAGPALAAISMKNIILARQERRGLTAQADQLSSFDFYPISPRSKLSFKEQIELSMKATAEGKDVSHVAKVQEVSNHIIIYAYYFKKDSLTITERRGHSGKG